MAKITYIEHSGEAHEIDVQPGLSLMEGAVKNGVPGIDADCGGSCACATCHVIIDPAWWERVGEPADDERDMLEFAQGSGETSRLSCQVPVTEALDGLLVRLPESQH